jgi:2-polyprenyl-3-methyl-5-hydroxy-6-metoxy-1,4-benzoquinol methylase
MTDCRLCGGATAVGYEGPVRAGTPGVESPRPFAVRTCNDCGVGFLDPFESLDYHTPAYRENYNSSSAVAAYFAAHDALQAGYLAQVSTRASLRDQVVADFGAGAGAFLDLASGAAKATIAIEPNDVYRASAGERGHLAYASVEDLLADPHAPRIDIAVTFHVIEHVADPVRYLRQIRQSLSDGGKLFVLTPNADDVLMRLGHDAYRRFNYRTAHLWYFAQASLTRCAEAAGFARPTIWFEHDYDMSNFALWLKDSVPTGTGRIDLFDRQINSAWKTFLEASGMASAIWMVADK